MSVEQPSGSWQRPPFSLTLATVLVLGTCGFIVALPSLFSQQVERKPATPAAPPTIPAPVLIDPDKPLEPTTVPSVPSASPAKTMEPAQTVTPGELNAAPPRVITGSPTGGDSATPYVPGLTPPPLPIIPQTVILEIEEKDGGGLGPMVSVKNAPHSFSRAGLPARNWIDQTQAQADAKSNGCLECHRGVEPMHKSPFVVLGCTDCHGGDATKGSKDGVVDGLIPGHVRPTYPEFWRTSANPANSSTILNRENPEFIRFVNPGDLRVAEQACGLCHMDSLKHVANSMMNTGQMLWGAALYNNGGFYKKNYVFGQSYGRDGAPLRVNNPYPVTPEMTLKRGILPYLLPLPRFNLGQPGNTLRIFEKGGINPPPTGIPETDARNGAPERGLSARGLGTLLRTDPVYLGLQKTRLHDPLLGFMGSNDHPGDYRSSGCTGCHTVYANDRSPSNSGWYSKYGHQGLSFSADPTMDKRERGHPISHQFSRAIPSSQCMNCHMHQGNLFVNPYLGYTWWDQESDGELMYPKEQHDPTDEELLQNVHKNPEAAAARGLWKDLGFLEKVAELNPKLKHTQFADYHGHGWIFRAIFKKDKHGNLLDLDDNKIRANDPNKWKKAVHLKDIHLEKGMQCVDCHFLRDVHGDGTLYTEPRAATSIECIDCHGTVNRRPTLITSGNGGQVNIGEGSTPFGPRFVWEDVPVTLTETVNGQPVERTGMRKALYQNSSMDANKRWEIPQTMDTVDPASPMYNIKSAYSKTLHRDGRTWGSVPAESGARKAKIAHNEEAITCQICHTSWATSCFGCHLPLKANQRIALNKFEGTTDRSFTTYNPQVVRDDVFMLGIDGTVKKHRMAVLRSSSAIIVSSQNANREWVYSQQQTVSAEGYSGQAFNPHFPHTTSSVGTTKNCTECHLSKDGDNNAWMTQFLGFGTGTANFFGRYSYMGAGEGGIHAIVWTEREEPQAAIGSHFHRIAYPRNYQEHLAKNMELTEAFEHHAEDIRDMTLRGEYLYTANGKAGFRVFDVGNIDNKAFSERFVTAPVSPIGQNTHVKTKGIATALALPSTLGIDPLRTRLPENQEQPIPLYYGFIYGTDTVEGLVNILVGTLVDGNPDNNYLKKDVTFNPDGLLNNATNLVAAGYRLYITCPQGLIVVSVEDPTKPRVLGRYSGSFLRNPRAVAIQFQYAFVTDEEGLKIFDIENPDRPVPAASVRLADAQKLYIGRTYAYVANGHEGLAIIDIEQPTSPRLFMMYNADGAINDAKAVQIGSISASMFALVADGKNGFKVVQLISPENVPEHMGFSPKPNPKLIATFPIHEGEAQTISRGLDRDRVVDETGSQTVVFGRRGSRPFHLSEMLPFLQHKNGETYRVEDVVTRKDDNGVRRLATRSGRTLSEPLAFNSPDGPVVAPSLGSGLFAPPPPAPSNEYLQQQSVERMLNLLDPTRPPDPLPELPAPEATPTPSGSPSPAPLAPTSDKPFEQSDEIDRLRPPRPAKPPESPTPQPSP
jgi:hypothetical protein